MLKIYKKYPTLIPSLFAAIILILGIPKYFPYGYYILLRWVVCIASIYVCYKAYEIEKYSVITVFAVVLLLFNPFFPMHLNKKTWVIFDIVVAGLFLFFNWFIKKTENYLENVNCFEDIYQRINTSLESYTRIAKNNSEHELYPAIQILKNAQLKLKKASEIFIKEIYSNYSKNMKIIELEKQNDYFIDVTIRMNQSLLKELKQLRANLSLGGDPYNIFSKIEKMEQILESVVVDLEEAFKLYKKMYKGKSSDLD